MPTGKDTAAQREEREKALTVPLRLEMIGIDLEKKGIYRLQLGFQPGTMPLPAFEQSLRTDYGGEIEVFLDDDLYKRLRYEDHAGFAPTPVGNGYGPVYYFAVDRKFLGPSRKCYLYPKIRAKKPCAYSLSISRERYSLVEKIGHLFRSPIDMHKTPSDRPTLSKAEMQHQAQVERIDILTEKKGRHFFTIGFHKPGTQNIDDDHSIVRAYDNFYDKISKDVAGNIEVYKNDKQYMNIKYAENGGRGWVGDMYHIAGYGYNIGDIDIDWYSFTPNITSFKEGMFGFGFKRSYTTM